MARFRRPSRCAACVAWRNSRSIADWTRGFAEFETEPGQTAIDVGGRIREDLLFEVPSYPHCDEGDDADRACPMGAAFETPTAEAAGSDAWGALDQLNLGAKKGSND